MARIIVNILGHQVAWWACVLSVRADAAWIGIGVSAVVFAVHLAVSPLRRVELWVIPVAAVLGYSADTAATLLGALKFEDNPQPVLPAPLWIFALWVAFATTLNTSLSWLRDRLGVAAVVGALSGPLAYAAGAALGVVALPNPFWSVSVLAVFWGCTLPIQILMATRAAGLERSAGVVLQECSGDAT